MPEPNLAIHFKFGYLGNDVAFSINLFDVTIPTIAFNSRQCSSTKLYPFVCNASLKVLDIGAAMSIEFTM